MSSKDSSAEKERIKLYDAETIGQLTWPTSAENEFAKRFLMPFITSGPQHYINNVNGKMLAMKVDDQVLPIMINDSEYHNSYVGSVYGQYISYGSQQLFNEYNILLSLGLKGGLEAFGKMLRWGEINKIVFVNNWLISTNLYPNLTRDQIELIRDFLIEKFPEHAIVFRSVCPYHMPDTYDYLKSSGFKMMLSRPVYFLNTKNDDIFETRIFKSDLRVLKNTEYDVVEVKDTTKHDFSRLAELYRMLNVDKYSKHNPQFNERYIELILKNKLIGAKMIMKEDKVYGVLGYFYRNGVKTSPLFGYDTNQPKEHKLYRVMATLLALEAKKRNLILHQSSGAGTYKLLRRAEKYMEYSAVWSRHLPTKQRFIWNVLRNLVNGIATPILKFYEP